MRWYADRRRQMANASPNAAHLSLAARPDISNVTQNTDDLLTRAGAVDLVQVHGDITRDRCHAGCGYTEPVDMHDPAEHRMCPDCQRDGLRPDVIWFGEGLDMATWQRAETACVHCDTLLVVGTSAVVHPAAGLIEMAKAAGAAIVIVNPDRSAASPLADVELAASADDILPRILDVG